MVRLVSSSDGGALPPVSGPGIGSSNSSEETGLNRPGTFGIDLLGGSAGLAGDLVSSTI